MPVLLNLAYMVFTVILFFVSGQVLYSFLDLSKPKTSVPLAILYTFVLIPVFHFLLYGLYRLRLRLCGSSDTADDTQEDKSSEEKPLNLETRTSAEEEHADV